MAILGEERQRREERKRWERSFAVFKYCSNKHLTVTIFLCSGWLESRRTEWARCKSPPWVFSKYHFVESPSTCTYCATFFSVSTFKVLLEGIYDEDSLLHKLRSPNNAVEHVMPILWGYLTGDWQVGLHDHFLNYILKIDSPINISMTHLNFRCTTRTKHRCQEKSL